MFTKQEHVPSIQIKELQLFFLYNKLTSKTLFFLENQVTSQISDNFGENHSMSCKITFIHAFKKKFQFKAGKQRPYFLSPIIIETCVFYFLYLKSKHESLAYHFQPKSKIRLRSRGKQIS